MFPMTQTAEDLMMGAPSAATARQLAELHIQLSRPAAKRP
jgi:aspartyl-tRNA synthetase